MTIDIVIPITRLWAVGLVEENLNRLDYGEHTIQLLFYVDSNDPKLLEAIQAIRIPLTIKSWSIHFSNNQPTLENKVSYRRNRIVSMRQATINLIKPADYVFSFEDDTELPANALTKLLGHMTDDASLGMVQGVQAGRWDLPMIGCWRVDDISSPTMVWTTELEEGLQEVDAGGFYCYVTRFDLYTTLPYSWHDECFGPDVMYGLEVSRAGYLCKTDYDLICGHKLSNGSILYPTGQELSLIWKLQAGKWMRQFTFLDAKRAEIRQQNFRQSGDIGLKTSSKQI